MASTTFVDNQTVIYAAWLNDVNNAVYNGNFVSSTLTATNMICTGTASGAGFVNLVNNTFASPAAIGNTTPNTGAFTSLTSNGVPVVTTTGTQTLTNKTIGSGYAGSTLTSSSVQNSTSGTSITFSSIPNWVKRITIMLSAVSTNGSSEVIFRLGTSGGIQSTGYLTASSVIVAAVVTTNDTTGFRIFNNGGASADVRNGALTLTLLDSATNTWTGTGMFGQSDSARTNTIGGSKVLSAALTQIQITTVNGTDTFDAGSINIIYE